MFEVQSSRFLQNLTNRVALVSASSRGLGKACALQLAQHGARVALFARKKADLDQVADEIHQQTATRPLVFPGDLTIAADIEKVVDETVRVHGQLDIVVANSGGPFAGTFEQMSDAHWHESFEHVFMSVVRLARSAYPYLKKSEMGRFIAITSTSVREPIDGLALSNALRPALIGLLKTLAREWGPFGITVNNIAPGFFDTDRMRLLHEKFATQQGITTEEARLRSEASIPLRRLGKAEELGAFVAFLCSDEGKYITGQTLFIDGGKTLSY